MVKSFLLTGKAIEKILTDNHKLLQVMELASMKAYTAFALESAASGILGERIAKAWLSEVSKGPIDLSRICPSLKLVAEQSPAQAASMEEFLT